MDSGDHSGDHAALRSLELKHPPALTAAWQGLLSRLALFTRFGRLRTIPSLTDPLLGLQGGEAIGWRSAADFPLLTPGTAEWYNNYCAGVVAGAAAT